MLTSVTTVRTVLCYCNSLMLVEPLGFAASCKYYFGTRVFILCHSMQPKCTYKKDGKENSGLLVPEWQLQGF